MLGKIIPGYPSDHEMFPLLVDENGALRESTDVFTGKLRQAYLETVDKEWRAHKPKTKSYSTDKDEIKQIIEDHKHAVGEIFPPVDDLLEEHIENGTADSFPPANIALGTFRETTTRRQLEEDYDAEPEVVEDTWTFDNKIVFRYFDCAPESLKDLTGKGNGSALWRMVNRCTPPMSFVQVILHSLKRMAPFLISAAIALTGWKSSSYLIKATNGGDTLLDILLIGAGQLAMALGGLAALWFFLENVLMNLGNIFADFSACIHRAQREKDLDNSRRLLYKRYRFYVLWIQALNRRDGTSTDFVPSFIKYLEQLLGISDQ